MARKFSNIAVETFLTVTAVGADTTLNVGDTTGWPTPGGGHHSIGALDFENQSKVELFSYTGKTATTFTGVTRGIDGTTAQQHQQGAAVRHVASAVDLELAANAIAATIADAKGDLLVGTAADTMARLAVGTNGQVPVADSSQASGIRWGTPAGDLLDYQYFSKAADESLPSSTTLQDDDDLVVPVLANEKWIIDFLLGVEGATGGDFKVDIAQPAGSSTSTWHLGPDLAATDRLNTNVNLRWGASASYGLVGAGSGVAIRIVVHLRMGATPGNLALRWAQETSNVTPTIVKAGSLCEARRVA